MYESWNSNTRTLGLIYMLLLGIRIISSILPGYIHPDEFFQSGQEIFFGSSQIPWEFQSQNAIRSIVPPIFMTLFPLRIYSFFCNRIHYLWSCFELFLISTSKLEEYQEYPNQCNAYNGYQILIIPRLFIALCSILAIDFPLWYLLYIKYLHEYQAKVEEEGEDSDTLIRMYKFRPIHSLLSIFHKSKDRQVPSFPPPIELLVYASSWPVLLFWNRTFTNTLETFVLTLLLAIIQKNISASRYNESHSIFEYVLVGILCSIGLFIRFTFLFFAFPVVMYFLYQKSTNYAPSTNTNTDKSKWKTSKISIKTETKTMYDSSKQFNLYSLIYCLIWIGISFVSISIIFIYVDSVFYNPVQNQNQNHCQKGIDSISTTTIVQEYECKEKSFQITITPINALLYNSKINNLSLHGLHPRITHILVNMPMLYGPLAILFYASILKKISKHNVISKRWMMIDNEERKQSTLLYQSIIVLSLLILSIAPHQEPRFLLPLSVPLMILHGRDIVMIPNKHKVHDEKCDCIQWRRYILQQQQLLLLWIGFNLLLYMFFGTLHQSGVIPSMMDQQQQQQQQQQQRYNQKNDFFIPPEAIIYYHTYMPPTFLSRHSHTQSFGLNTREEVNEYTISSTTDIYQTVVNTRNKIIMMENQKNCPSSPIIDLKGSNVNQLEEKLGHYLSCTNEVSNFKCKGFKYVKMITPLTLLQTNKDDSNVNTVNSFCPSSLGMQYSCQMNEIYSWHISTEDLPIWNGNWNDYLSDLKLVSVDVFCSNVDQCDAM